MWISRMRVTGGFLEGLDIEFSPGLNVIVGPRGAGKTTLLELLRHALALPAGSGKKEHRAFMRHALGAGEVVVDIRSADGFAERLIVDASGGGNKASFTNNTALMLGQNELEDIADSPARRLALIDARAGLNPGDDRSVMQQVGALTVELHRLRRAKEVLLESLRMKQSLLNDRARLSGREREFLGRQGNVLGPQRKQLSIMEGQLLGIRANIRSAEHLGSLSSAMEEELRPISERVRRMSMISLGSDMQGVLDRSLETLQKALSETSVAVADVAALAANFADRLNDRDLILRAQAEPIRRSLDQTERGLGAITAEMRDLDAQLARLGESQREFEDIEREEWSLRSARDRLQARIEDEAEAIFAVRRATAQEISAQLEHRVQIPVAHFADSADFREMLLGLLQGSGLRYNSVGDAIAETVIPSVMLRYIEDNDVEGLAAASGLTPDRAARVLASLDSESAVAAISQAALTDSVDFRIQDGSVLKTASEMSTGQKCAVTMPIVLTDLERIVILDQPEDHLDNKFLVERILNGLNRRTASGAQTIVATHNANIPVLGSAQLVAHLSSNGSQGGVEGLGSYDSPGVVSVITNLMEGGADAFARRAEFYGRHSSAQ